MRLSLVFFIVAMLCLAAILVSTISAVLTPHKAYGIGDSGRVVTASKGDSIAVNLQENPSTGYSWQITASDGLTQTGDQYLQDNPVPFRVGAGGTHVWNFRVTGSGVQHISAVYQRPWESKAPAKTFSLTIQVGDSTGSPYPLDNNFSLPRMFGMPAKLMPQGLYKSSNNVLVS